MKQGTYIGPIPQLKALRALLRDVEGDEDSVIAQFDDFTAQSNGVQLAWGWHPFPRKDFKLDPAQE
jgi:hypothetical protein